MFDIAVGANPGSRIVKPFSLGRSVRGQLESFERPEIAVGDDIETLDSSFGTDQVRERINRITEAFESLDNEKGSFTIFANNFDRRCVTNVLLKEQEEGLISPDYQVHVYKAWKGRPLWPQRFPAKSENELKRMLRVRDESNWQGNYQQNPVPPDGFIFKREFYQEWQQIPKDARGVIYTDQNLSKKSKGDTTAAVALLFSRKTGKLYIQQARCRSFAKSADLFSAIFEMYTPAVKGIAFDGNVSQESYWTEILDGFAVSPEAVKNFGDAPRILRMIAEFKRYRVDDIAVNLQLIYEQSKLYFPPSFAKSEEGSRFLNQFFAFAGKKRNKTDDAPDALICAYNYLLERSLAKKGNFADVPVQNFDDYYKV